jgi:hypothetical protein
MLENLPTAESIRMVESREKKRLKAKQKRHCQARRQPGNPASLRSRFWSLSGPR